MKKIVLSVIVLSRLIIVSPASAANMSILVNPFKNTGGAEYSWISAGMTDTVINDLNRIRDVNVIADGDREKVLREMELGMTGIFEDETITRVGKIIGANIIFTGTYLVAAGDRIRVLARLINVATGKTEKSAKLDGTLESIFDLQDRIVLALMAETEKIEIKNVNPVVLSRADAKKIVENEKPGFDAFKLYAKGLEVRYTDPKTALSYYKKALAVDPEYAEALREAGYTAGNTLNLFNEALGYLVRADNVYRKRGDAETIEYADMLKNTGVVYRIKGQPDTALEYYLRSKAAVEKIGAVNSYLYCRVIMNIGNLYRGRGQSDMALDYYMKSQAVADAAKFQDTYDYARLMSNIGVAYLFKGELDSSLAYLKRSGGLYEKFGFSNSVDYGFTLTNIGNIYRKRGEFDPALEHLMKAKKIDDRLGLQGNEDYGILMLNIGRVYSGMGQAGRSLEYYSRSKSVYDSLELQNTVNYADLLLDLAAYYEKKGDIKSAGDFFRKAYSTYDKAGYTGESKNAARRNAERLGY